MCVKRSRYTFLMGRPTIATTMVILKNATYFLRLFWKRTPQQHDVVFGVREMCMLFLYASHWGLTQCSWQRCPQIVLLIDWLVAWLIGCWMMNDERPWLMMNDEWLIDWITDAWWLVIGLLGWLIDWLPNDAWWRINDDWGLINDDWIIDWVVDWSVDWLIDWLIAWVADWFIDWLLDWLMMDSFMNRVAGWVIKHMITDWWFDSLIYWLIDCLLGGLLNWLLDQSPGCSLVDWLVKQTVNDEWWLKKNDEWWMMMMLLGCILHWRESLTTPPLFFLALPPRLFFATPSLLF